MPTGERFVANYKDGKWDEGAMTTDATVTMSECAGVLQYAQTCFEGLKAYTTQDGKIVVFRPDLNAARMQDSCKRLEMPVLPENMFVDAVCKVVKANADYVPPYGSGATLYLRPYMFGIGPVIGVKPSTEYQFRLFATPVGPYFKGGAKPITIKVSDFDRAAPHGTGHIKAGLNYAMSLHAIVTAHEEGFAENMYLDAATRTKVEETGGANFIFVTKDGKVVTPKSNSIPHPLRPFQTSTTAPYIPGTLRAVHRLKKQIRRLCRHTRLCPQASFLTPSDSEQEGTATSVLVFSPHLTAKCTPVGLFACHGIPVRKTYREVFVKQFKKFFGADFTGRLCPRTEELRKLSEVLAFFRHILLFTASCEVRADNDHFHGESPFSVCGFSRLLSVLSAASSFNLNASLPEPQIGRFKSSVRLLFIFHITYRSIIP